MQYVTNINSEPTKAFTSAEHFPSHPDGTALADVQPAELRARLRRQEEVTGFPWWFKNGEARFAAGAWEGLSLAIRDITQEMSLWGYRIPDDLSKWGDLADLLIHTNAKLMALLLGYGDATIGEKCKRHCVPWPSL
jgi:hypothetical protein